MKKSTFQMIRDYIKKNWLNATFKIIKIFLVAYLSFYLLKLCSGIDMVQDFWTNHERYYLGSYVTIQIIVGFILYDGVGKILNYFTNKWIQKNEAEMTVKISREDKREMNSFINLCFNILLWLKLFTPDELGHLDEIDETKHTEKWKKTVWIIQNCVGIATLGLANLYCIGMANALFITLVVILVSIIFASVIGLIVYYVLVKNLHLINAFINSYNVTSRMMKRQNKSLPRTQ